MNTDSINTSPPPVRTLQTDTASSTIRQRNQVPVADTKVSEQKTEQQPERTPDKAEVKDAVDQLAKFVSSRQSQISFSIDESSGSQIVKVVDTESKEVIRQFPSQEAIAIAHALDKLQGLLIRDKA